MIIQGNNNFECRLGCFTYYFFHAVLMLVSSVTIAVKLTLAVRSKRNLTHVSSKGGEKGGAGASGSRREMQAAITVCTMALMQCLAYFPTAVTCMAVCLANESPQFALVRFSFNHLKITLLSLYWLVSEFLLDLQDNPNLYSIISVCYDMGNLTFSVAHVWNFYIYMLRVCVSSHNRNWNVRVRVYVQLWMKAFTYV